MPADETEYRELLGAIERRLSDDFALYERVRRLASLPETVQARVLELFRSPEGKPAEMTLKPYQAVTPHIAFGFENGLAATLAWRPRAGAAGFAEEFSNALDLTLADRGGSRWFTLEVAAPWWELRRAEALSLLAAARLEGDVHASIEVYVWDRAGGRHTVGSRAFRFEAAAPMLQLDLPIAIPDDIVLDERRDPKVVLFLPREPQSLTLDHLWLRLH